MTVTVRRPDLEEVERRIPEFVDLYREAYTEWPYLESPDHIAEFIDRFASESASPGFDLVIAEDEGAMIGYAYGVAFGPDQWWDDADEEPEDVHGHTKFAVMEFVVRKTRRQHGVGTVLMNALLSGRPEPLATLCSNPESPAREIYRRWKWEAVALARPPSIPVMDVLLLRLST